jgi:hypothetical protein
MEWFKSLVDEESAYTKKYSNATNTKYPTLDGTNFSSEHPYKSPCWEWSGDHIHALCVIDYETQFPVDNWLALEQEKEDLQYSLQVIGSSEEHMRTASCVCVVPFLREVISLET